MCGYFGTKQNVSIHLVQLDFVKSVLMTTEPTTALSKLLAGPVHITVSTVSCEASGPAAD